MRPHFPRGVEVVCAAVIRNQHGEIFLAQSPKWSNKWVTPGGHVDPGETLFQAAVREAQEETGLIVKPLTIFAFEEMINPPDFTRPAHLISFRCLVEYVSGEVKLQDDELTAYQWILPEKAFDLPLGGGVKKIIEQYLSLSPTQ